VVPVVELQDVNVRWGARTVLQDVNLRLEPGERLVVVGPSGAGKSTILRLMAGLLLPSAGAIRIHGTPQTYLRLDQRHAPDVRLVFQNPALLASLTVRQNVGFLLDRFSHMSEAEIRQRVGDALDAVGLAGTEDLYPGELSGGMQKRSTILRTADRVVLLYDGEFRWQGSVADFQSTTNLYVLQFRTASLSGPMQPAEL
jgi:phospholipid/cholesterol/gamma-HCH transport system ATP-binding protein